MNTAVISHEENLLLIKRAQAGDGAAEEQLVVNNIALVKSIVRGYLRRSIEYDDLIQIGSLGLVKAIQRYDPSFGVRFSTYAVPMISGEIKRHLRDDGIIKVSRCLKENAIKIYRAQDMLKKALGRDPELSELEKETGLTKEDIIESLDAVRDPISLDNAAFSTHGNESKAKVLDTMSDERADSEGDLIIDRIMIEQLLSELDERERKIILLRYFRDKTQLEIASDIGVSQVQVSRLLSKALKKLKEIALK